MADLLERGATWLAGQRHAHLTRPVTYCRDLGQVVLQATIGRSEFEQVDEHGLVVRSVLRDYLVRAADLVLGGARVLPRAGDRIREAVSETVTLVYEVVSPSPDEPPYRTSDPYGITLRIHTRHVDTEDLGGLP